jgi:hypothetical protein
MVSVENQNVVDIISIAPDGKTVILKISDHLDWNDTLGHQNVLQAKLNRYLAFVEGGELFEKYPAATGLPIVFEVVFRFKPDRSAQAFLSRAKTIVEGAGFALRTTVFAESYNN